MPAKLIIFFSLLSATAGAFDWPFGSLKGSWTVESGSVGYHLRHLVHHVRSENKNIKGTVLCEEVCKFEIKTNVSDFKTAEPERDKAMLVATRAEKYPEIRVSGEFPTDAKESFVSDITIDFAGKSVRVPQAKFSRDGESKLQNLKSDIDIKLSQFDIERPKLFSVPIEDVVTLEVKLMFAKE